jgi:hypothetical protein
MYKKQKKVANPKKKISIKVVANLNHYDTKGEYLNKRHMNIRLFWLTVR